MNSFPDEARVAYFDSIATAWDGWHDRAEVQANLTSGLIALGVEPDETVLDVGCGTGNLTAALLGHLSGDGRVIAADFAPRMIEVARSRIVDARVRWLCAAADHLPLADSCCDRAICFSMWPHLSAPDAAARELARVVRAAGSVHVWHASSRERINAIHAAAGEAVRGDVLPPAADVAALLARCGFSVTANEDEADHYLVSATRRPTR